MKTMIKLSLLLFAASLQTLSLQATDYSYGYGLFVVYHPS